MLQLGASRHHSRSKDAFVTLQYGDYHLGARVLGKNLQDTGTYKDMVAMCTATVSDETKTVLAADGWIIKPVEKIPNPYEGHSEKGNYFSGAYTKLHIWNMTEYERVVFLDSDVLIVSNIDHLFDCGSFCAAYRHSDIFNSGVMVVEPSSKVFNDMIKKIPIISSYDDADQGFLNAYFKDLKYAHLFNWSDTTRHQTPKRLPTGCNANVGWYYSNSEWKFEESELWIIHYTLGPTKPWVWWAHRLFDLNWKWVSVRKTLPRYDSPPSIIQQPLFWAPYPLGLLVYVALRFSCRWLTTNMLKLRYFAIFNKRFSHFVPIPILCVSYYLAFSIVPTTMLPIPAEYVLCLWSNFFILLFMGTYCSLCHITNKVQDVPYQNISKKLLQTFLLYLLLTISHIMQTLIPLAVLYFSTRVRVFLALTMLHVVIGQAVGQAWIRIWSKSNGRYANEKNRYSLEHH